MVKKIESYALRDLVYREIKQMILNKQFLAGEKILQEKLAKELGISRTPLREALQMLEAEHLLVSKPNIGVFVKTFGKQEIVDIFECRVALECLAVRLFIQHAEEKLFQKLGMIFAPYQLGEDPIPVDKYQKADDEFHQLLVTGSRNPFLADLFNKGNLKWAISHIGLLRPPEETLPEHWGIIEAIQKQEVELAVERMRIHISISKDLVAQQMENEPI